MEPWFTQAAVGATAAQPASIAVAPIGAEILDTSATRGSRPWLYAAAPTGAKENVVITLLRTIQTAKVALPN